MGKEGGGNGKRVKHNERRGRKESGEKGESR